MIALAISVIVATEGLVPISTSVSYLPTIAIRMRLAPIPQVHILVCARRDSSATASLAMSLTSAYSHDCHADATCIDTYGSYNCMCLTGYHGDGKTCCNDINECENGMSYLSNHSCSPNAQCTNTIGSYTCSCNPGYSGNGHVCTDIDECPANCHPTRATCANLPGSYQCTCTTGYTGDGILCTDVNECIGANNCDPNADCTNTVGSIRAHAVWVSLAMDFSAQM